MSDDFWVKVDLPSGFKPYKQKEMWLRPMTVSEVKKVMPAISVGDASEVLNVLDDNSKGIKISDLTTGDAWFALMWLRNNTFPNLPIQIEWKCAECGSAHITNLSMENVDIEELPEEYCEPAILTLSSGKEVPIRYHRAGDYQRVEKYLKKLLNRNPNDAEIEEAKSAIIIDNGKSLSEKIEFLKTLTPEESLEIDSFMGAFEHGIKEQVQDTCKECGAENSLRYRFLIFDLVPKSRDKGSIRASVRFGKVSKDTDEPS